MNIAWIDYAALCLLPVEVGRLAEHCLPADLSNLRPFVAILIIDAFCASVHFDAFTANLHAQASKIMADNSAYKWSSLWLAEQKGGELQTRAGQSWAAVLNRPALISAGGKLWARQSPAILWLTL